MKCSKSKHGLHAQMLKELIKYFELRHWSFNLMPVMQCPFDVLLEGCVRIEHKSANRAVFFQSRTGKDRGFVDAYVYSCLVNGELHQCWLPGEYVEAKNQAHISLKRVLREGKPLSTLVYLIKKLRPHKFRVDVQRAKDEKRFGVCALQVYPRGRAKHIRRMFTRV